MKTYNHLFAEIISWENLCALRKELETGTYRPEGYREFYIYDAKKRKISAASFRDRVVHHAVCNVIMPSFEKTFIDTSFANRKGKGTHRAVHLCKRYMSGGGLQMQAFFLAGTRGAG